MLPFPLNHRSDNQRIENGILLFIAAANSTDLLFQVISCRYEKESIVITSNRACKHLLEVFNNDATLTSATLGRLLHQADTVVIEGKSYRIKQQVEV